MEIITLILTSAIVSGLISFFLKYIFENKQQRKFNLEIEKLKHIFSEEHERLKSKLELREGVISTINDEKLKYYPKICELVYKTRNLTRDMTKDFDNDEKKGKLRIETEEIEAHLYKYRIYLEDDQIFYLVHSYKNLLISYMQNCKESRQDNLSNLSKTLENLYAKINMHYSEIVSEFNLKLNTLQE